MGSLEEKLNLKEINPMEEFNKLPNVYNLAQIAKSQQTYDMLQRAFDNYDGYGEILKVASKKLLTYDLCKIACEKRGSNLQYVPKKFLDVVICEIAVKCNPRALAYVPEEWRTYELCLFAVSNDSREEKWLRQREKCALASVPKALVDGSDGQKLCEIAVEKNSLAIEYVPLKYITKSMAYKAVKNSWPGGFYEYTEIVEIYKKHQLELPEPEWHTATVWPIAYIPEEIIDRDLVEYSVKLFPESIAVIPRQYKNSYVTLELCQKVMEHGWRYLKYIPDPFCKNSSIINAALKESPLALGFVPMEKRTKKRCFDAKKRGGDKIPLEWFPDRIADAWMNECEERKNKDAINIEPIMLPDIEVNMSGSIVVADTDNMIIHESSDNDSDGIPIYYITDIHLEHHLPAKEYKDFKEIETFIQKKVEELIPSLKFGRQGIILIGGDVACNLPFVSYFYKCLRDNCNMPIISVLGNHELWDGNFWGFRESRLIDTIIGDYKDAIEYYDTYLLENELYLQYKGYKKVRLDEKKILEVCDAELTEICEKSSIIILGGLGFSGLEPKFNASMGLYRNTVTLEEDRKRSDRFRIVYEKVRKCAGDKHVIVLTHTPINNWTYDTPNPKWIYVNGHTHKNGFVCNENGATVYFDNQVGYKKSQLHFNTFFVDNIYDPLKELPDGIHEIFPEQYVDFNRGRGIYMSRFCQQGKLYALKQNNIYMFMLQNGAQIYWLEGGRLHSAEHGIEWYYENISSYYTCVQRAFTPYRNVLQMISNEVKIFGGYGTIHGCIIDIDYRSHIYLNPYDGSIHPYYADDMTNKYVYSSVYELLKRLDLENGTSMLTEFISAEKENLLPTLAEKGNKLAKVSNAVLVTDRTIYEPSRILRSIQYVFDRNVIRQWNDEVLKLESLLNFSINDLQLLV